jgi:hypothetical protein
LIACPVHLHVLESSLVVVLSIFCLLLSIFSSHHQTNHVIFQFGGEAKFLPISLVVPSPTYAAQQLGDYVCVSNHPQHPLQMNLMDSTGWACNGAALAGGDTSGCISGCTDFFQTMGMKRFTCQQCDFDMCQSCVTTHLAEDQSRAVEKINSRPAMMLVSTHPHPLTRCSSSPPPQDHHQQQQHNTGVWGAGAGSELFALPISTNSNSNSNSTNANANAAISSVGASASSASASASSASAGLVCWTCAGSRRIGGCKAGLQPLSQSSADFFNKRYRCEQCDYALCKFCARFYEKTASS